MKRYVAGALGFVVASLLGVILVIGIGRVQSFLSPPAAALQSANRIPLADSSAEDATPLDREMSAEQIQHSKLFEDRYPAWSPSLRQQFLEGRIVQVGPGIYEYVPQRGPKQTPGHYYRALASTADLVIVGVVRAKVSFFTAGDGFLFTDYDVEVEKNLSPVQDPSYSGGTHIVVTRPGGAVRDAGRTFRAVESMYEKLEAGDHRYLLFLKASGTPRGFVALTNSATFEIAEDRLRDLSDAPLPPGVGEALKSASWSAIEEVLESEQHTTRSKGAQ